MPVISHRRRRRLLRVVLRRRRFCRGRGDDGTLGRLALDADFLDESGLILGRLAGRRRGADRAGQVEDFGEDRHRRGAIRPFGAFVIAAGRSTGSRRRRRRRRAMELRLFVLLV